MAGAAAARRMTQRMFHRILVPTDGSAVSTAAVDAAIALASATGGSLVVLHAYPVFRGGAYGTSDGAREVLAQAREERAKGAAATILDETVARARIRGIACEAVMVESDRPWETIIAVSKRRHCDAICMASHGRRGVAGVVLGSETAKVLTHCTLPVLVIR